MHSPPVKNTSEPKIKSQEDKNKIGKTSWHSPCPVGIVATKLKKKSTSVKEISLDRLAWPDYSPAAVGI